MHKILAGVAVMCMLLCGCAKTAESHATTVPGESQATVTSAEDVSLATTSETEISSLPVSSDEQTVLTTKTTTGRTTTVSVSESTKTTTTTGRATTVSASGSTKTTTSNSKVSQIFPAGDESWRTHPQDYKLIALTFDDAPMDVGGMLDIMEILRSYGGSATFFACGIYIEQNGIGALQTALDNGFEIGNHTYSHPQLTQLNQAEIYEEIRSLNALLKKELGITPKFFRPGFLHQNLDVYAAANRLKMPLIGCVSAPDTKADNTAETIYNDIVHSAKDGDIFLLHINRRGTTTMALPDICKDLYEQNFRFVTVGQLYEYKGLTPVYFKRIDNVLEQ